MAKSSIFKARLKVVIVLGYRQLYGSEFQTEGELRLKDFADIARDIRGIVSSSLLEERNVLQTSDILVLKLISVLVFILFSSQNFYFI